MDNQTALSSLRDSEARLQAALDHVQAAIRVLKPAEVLPVPAHTNTHLDEPQWPDFDEELDALHEAFSPRPRKARKPRKWSPQKRAAFSRKMKRVMTEKWASLTKQEHDQWQKALQAGRRS